MRHVDPVTANLILLTREHTAIQRSRIKSKQRLKVIQERGIGFMEVVLQRGLDGYSEYEVALKELVAQAFCNHVMADWCEERPGLGDLLGPSLAALIRCPWLFPGQRCDAGHYHPPLHGVGDPCPSSVWEAGKRKPCKGVMLPPREGAFETHKGAKSLWHYAGAHVLDGRMPKRARGQQSSWKPEFRVLLFGPQKIGYQIRRRVRIPEAEHGGKPEGVCGLDATPRYSEQRDRASRPYVLRFIEKFHQKMEEGKTRGHAIRIARTHVAKKLAADFLREWKCRLPLEKLASTNGR